MTTETYFEIVKRGEQKLGLKLLTPQYEVVAMLLDVDTITPLDMLRQFSGSNTGFYKILKDLEAKGVVSAETNPLDHRSKLYRLSDQALASFMIQWGKYTKEGYKEIRAKGDPADHIHRYTQSIRGGLKINQFTCEYQILVYLNATPGLTNLNFRDLVDVSPTKFGMSLTSLEQSGHVFFERDSSDRRKKLYHITENTRAVIDDMVIRVFPWFDRKLKCYEALRKEAS